MTNEVKIRWRDPKGIYAEAMQEGQLRAAEEASGHLRQVREDEIMRQRHRSYIEELKSEYGDLTGVEWWEVIFSGPSEDRWLPGDAHAPFSIELRHLSATYYEFCKWGDHPWSRQDPRVTGRPIQQFARQGDFDHLWAVEEEDAGRWVPFTRAETSEVLARLHFQSSFVFLLEAQLYAQEQLLKAREVLRKEFEGEDLAAREFEIMKALVEVDSWG